MTPLAGFNGFPILSAGLALFQGRAPTPTTPLLPFAFAPRPGVFLLGVLPSAAIIARSQIWFCAALLAANI